MGMLMLLRHAKAHWARPGTRDFDRPLDAQGRNDAAAIAEAMNRRGLEPDRAVCSGARRARETWAEVSAVLRRRDIPMETSDLLYASDAQDYLRVIRESAEEALLLVGHNPMIEDVAFALAGNGDPDALNRLEHGFPTAGLAVLTFDGPAGRIAPGGARLVHFLSPRDLP